MKHQIFCIKHYGERMVGSGACLVVADHEFFAREMVFQHFLNKQDRGEPLQIGAKSLLQVEPLEESFLANYPVSLEERGVRIEYQYGEVDGAPYTKVVYIADGTDALATELDTLQRRQNDGRGVSCVRSIVTYLQRGDLTSAKAIAYNEGDKIASYPEIEAVLKRVGFVYQTN